MNYVGFCGDQILNDFIDKPSKRKYRRYQYHVNVYRTFAIFDTNNINIIKNIITYSYHNNDNNDND